ncbi:multidrug efflux RND transporter permease subunit [Oceanobacter mangrovi]|uniref:multidrug efflux RND transporter permease subunit n=1 Tax=Oceanobacter mangrovi TaxID=2862510 RepID=UPI001C8EB6BB|nr:multidrug efflux RND transporter permease subunit [Oceanobacter mangrovi]
MIARFFIDRPVLAWVLAVILLLAGLAGLQRLPVSQYPDIAPPIIRVATVYPGASAQVVENSVTQILEQQLKGLENLLYFEATSSSSGEAELMLTFQHGTDPAMAQVQVQNLINQVASRLPSPVQQAGLAVTAMRNTFLMVAVFYDQTGSMTDHDIADWMNSTVLDPVSRIPGVGTIRPFGSPYAMRIWLDPIKLNRFQLVPEDVVAAIDRSNTEVPVGELGARPLADGQALNVAVTALSRLQTPQQFRDIVLKSDQDGALVRLGDVARVEIGAESYATTSRLNGHPASGMAIMQSPGANALTTAAAIKQRLEQLSGSFPPGIQIIYPEDTTRFVERSIKSVLHTLAEAVVLVVLVMFLFLQNWRTTLIPALTVPIVLLGTFAVLAIAGYSINTLTLFAMVLAIGLLVDDAIVVVENVEARLANGMPVRQATLESMRELSWALVGIAVVLAAVFLPMAFFPGSVGVIYRQFSVTLVAAMVLSVVVALTLTPTLCVLLLGHRPAQPSGWRAALNQTAGRWAAAYPRLLSWSSQRSWRLLFLYVLLLGATWQGFLRLPTAFIPEDDQGTVLVRYTLPPGATYHRTAELVAEIENYFMTAEAANVEAIYTVSGFSFNGSGQNSGVAFAVLKDWDERPGAENSAQAIARRATGALNQIRDARAFAMVLPPIDGLGESNGFEFWLQDTGGLGRQQLLLKARELADQAAAREDVLYAEASAADSATQLKLDIDQQRAQTLGLDLQQINRTLGIAWGGEYVGDFVHQGRIKKVLVQGDAIYRSHPTNLQDWWVGNGEDGMTPLSAFTASRWQSGPSNLARFNGLPAVSLSGAADESASSAQLMAGLESLARQIPHSNIEWSGLSYQDRVSSGQAPLLYLVSVLFVFLCLAVLYGSWSIPFSVLLVIPLGLLGAVAGVMLLGTRNDIFFQVGVLTTMGLSAKNAILIVEFAELAVRQGSKPLTAALEAARQRLRPILMTSLAFGAGVVPLVLATGPGAAAQQAIGSAVLGGVASATLLVLLYVPLCYVLIRRITGVRAGGRVVAGERQQPVSGAG